MSIIDKFLGCMVGLAVGDALGAPLEFMTAEQISQQHGRVTEMIGGGWLKLEPGEVTDDTQMALCLLRSLALHRGLVNLGGISHEFRCWRAGGPKDIGLLTGKVLRARGSLPAAAKRLYKAAYGSAASNGGVMRCAPVALAFALKPVEQMIAALTDTCQLTHWDPRCVDSCLLAGMLIREVITGEDADYTRLLQPESTTQYLDAVVFNPQYSGYASGFTLNPVAHAHMALRDGLGFEEGLVRVVNLGGDADTNGAVVGAVLGAEYGLAAIPDRWLRQLRGLGELCSLTAKLYGAVA